MTLRTEETERRRDGETGRRSWLARRAEGGAAVGIDQGGSP